MSESLSIQFQFDEVLELKQAWKDNRHLYSDNIRLVISHHWASEGWWIETLDQPRGHEGDLILVGGRADEYVDKLVLPSQRNKTPDWDKDVLY